MSNNIVSTCPICDYRMRFSSFDDSHSCRDNLISNECPLGKCLVRERAVARTIFSIVNKDSIKSLIVHEPAPVMRGLSGWLSRNVPAYIKTGYFPDEVFGEYVSGLRNENLECQTFEDNTFDIVLHLDVLEHLFDPFKALNEIYRTLKSDGFCVFTVPTEPNRLYSQQVATIEDGKLVVIGEAEYHGNPQRPDEGSLVTWRYGYDLPLLIGKKTLFNVEVRRWQDKSTAIQGYMADVYILTK